MNVANRELSDELFILSGWMDTSVTQKYDKKGDYWSSYTWFDPDNDVPAYDLGYLLRKLPPIVTMYKAKASYRFKLMHIGIEGFTANTPEDAAAKLCIELFKQGILTKDTE